MAMHFVIVDEKLKFPKVTSYATRAEAEAACPTPVEGVKMRAIVASSIDELKVLDSNTLVMVYNRISEKPVRRFETHAVAIDRTWRALNGATLAFTPTPEENTAMATTQTTEKPKTKAEKPAKVKAEKRPRAKDGKPAKLVSELRQVRAGTARATVLKLISARGGAKVSAVAKAIENTEARVYQHAYCLWRDCGIGYQVEDETITAVYPGSKGLTDLIKAEKE